MNCWLFMSTTNPIESTFATVRHCTKRSKGCLSQDTAFIMVFKLLSRFSPDTSAPSRGQALEKD